MNNIYLVFLSYLFTTVVLTGQSNHLQINTDIVLPEDAPVHESLIYAIENFLSSAEQNIENEWVLTSENVETQLLIDEIENIQKSEKFSNDHFFKPYLTNVVLLENENYEVQVAYIGIGRMTAYLRANFRFIAHKSTDGYLISSPLKSNTRNWKAKKIENVVFHFPYTLNIDKVNQFAKLTSMFDNKLDNTEVETHHYLCTDEMDPLELFGVTYKSDYNGQKMTSSSSIDKKMIHVETASEFYEYDTHDLWHYRLSQVVSRREVHRRVDCHIASLYGGLWGRSWNELFPIFRDKFLIDNNVDWLELKKKSAHFVLDGRKTYSDDFVGALLVKKIENEIGFDGVRQLLMTKRSKEEIEYFEALNDLVGINKDNYNQEVYKLIQKELDTLGI